MKVKAKDIFTKASAVLDELGWTQGQYGGRNDCFQAGSKPCCVVGAIHQAAEDLTGKHVLSFSGSIQPLCDRLEKMTTEVPFYDSTIKSIIRWNDQPERTVEQVKELLLRAAEEAGDTEYEIDW